MTIAVTMKNTLHATSAVFLLFFCQGCASIISGHSTQLSFDSNPSGAQVRIDGRPVGQTPTSLLVSKKALGTVEFSKEGYKPAIVQLRKGFNPIFLGNVIIGGFFGSTTDVASGAVQEYEPRHYFATLSPADAAPLTERISLSETQKAKEFVVVSYRDIVSDLGRGEGEYLSSLLALLRVPDDAREPAIRRLRALAEAYPTIPEFADRVVEAFAASPGVPAP